MHMQSLETLINLIENNDSIYTYGIVDEATGHFVYSLNQKLNRPVFVVLENDKKARDLYEGLIANNLNCYYLPELTKNFHLIEDYDYSNRTLRMQAITAMISKEPAIILSSRQAIFRKMLKPDLFEEQIISIDLNSEIDQEKLISKLIKLGYQRRNIIQAKGEFAIRGDIIDIFQVHDEQATRIELFDIEVDSIRKFDINTQMSTDQIDDLKIYPITDNNFESTDVQIVIEKIKNDLELSKTKLSQEKFDRVSTKFNRIIEEIENNSSIENMDLLIPYLDNNNYSIFDYLAEDSLIIFDDLSKLISISNEMDQFNSEDIENRIENGEILDSHREIEFNFDDMLRSLNKKSLNISGVLKSVPDFKFDKIYELKIRENIAYHGRFEDLISDLKFKIDEAYTNIIYANNLRDAEGLKELIEENGLKVKLVDTFFNSDNKYINIVTKSLMKGFEYFEDKLNFISYNQIFNKTKKRKSKTVKNKEIINYVDLTHGDLLVHDNYGIGQYNGIKNIELNGIKSDFIELTYNKGDKLFVPTSDMSMVSKFIGNADKKPKLSNLNGADWKRTKAKAKKAIEEIAEDLVKLYAIRSQVEGFEYSPDSSWQNQFEDDFPYVETDAQLRAVSDIKKDMESSRVMDRLLAGDVGYGKTEVALRAAFKAVMDSKQVVMLAPTTILVKQHFNTMQKRFSNFPVNIDYLSRFKTPSQKKETLDKLKRGEIDFIVGTHSLLSDKIQFKNLGLLIIDEEQRFGVKHKEKIKEISENIDVLTLSATPIPRTLQMSLSGIREMSLLDEYPQNRLPVNTYVMEYDPIYIREAIIKEMARGGQVYFVYNKVRSINLMYKKLTELVPEARIAVSHGQMSTRELENILEDFSNQKYDILLTTTIIETGMDIQNVNTIIVYNADMMGLSQLYQLKGRVGRSDRNSYAYFTFAEGKVMTEIAEKRLKAIKDFTELGSGYKVAMRDLELRGAGNLLGESQSGHIESVGYDLYVRMLKEQIDEIKGIRPMKPLREVNIDLNLDVYIPDDYIPDENEKINIYKKISYIDSDQDHYAIIDELTDRFGDMPKPVQNIVDISYIRSLMVRNFMDNLKEFDSEIMLSYTNLDVFNFEKLKVLAEEYRGFMRFDMTEDPSIFIENDGNYTIKLIKLLELIQQINNQ